MNAANAAVLDSLLENARDITNPASKSPRQKLAYGYLLASCMNVKAPRGTVRGWGGGGAGGHEGTSHGENVVGYLRISHLPLTGRPGILRRWQATSTVFARHRAAAAGHRQQSRRAGVRPGVLPQ